MSYFEKGHYFYNQGFTIKWVDLGSNLKFKIKHLHVIYTCHCKKGWVSKFSLSEQTYIVKTEVSKRGVFATDFRNKFPWQLE